VTRKQPRLGREDALARGFFRVENSILRVSGEWSRDALLLYLLHCRGHDDKTGCSQYGYDGARRLLHLSHAEWRKAKTALESAGAIRTMGTKDYPRTIISPASEPFTVGLSVENNAGAYRQHDGHASVLTRESGDICLPWRAMEVERLAPEAHLGTVVNRDSLRLLLYGYGHAEPDGWIPSHTLWLDFEGQTGLAADRGLLFEELEMLPPDAVLALDAARELFALGLVEQRDLDLKGRGVLFLTHPLQLPEQAERLEDAA
jgi:hypothetical protein